MPNRKRIYETTVKSTNKETKYTVSTGGSFKDRWSHEWLKNINNTDTELSKYIWKLKENKVWFVITWKILHKIGNNKNIR